MLNSHFALEHDRHLENLQTEKERNAYADFDLMFLEISLVLDWMFKLWKVKCLSLSEHKTWEHGNVDELQIFILKAYYSMPLWTALLFFHQLLLYLVNPEQYGSNHLVEN